MYYEKRNMSNLMKLAKNTKKAALQWYEYCKDKELNILVYETVRSVEKQREYVNSGASQTMQSYHLVGQALDFVAVNKEGKALWESYENLGIKNAISHAKRLGFTWGGDWKMVDKPHLQFLYKGYGTDPFFISTNKMFDFHISDNMSINEDEIKLFQSWLNNSYKVGIKIDGLYGPKTRKAAIKGLQFELNKQYNRDISVDGIWGPKTKSASVVVSINAKGSLVKIIQGMLYCFKLNPKGFDGIFGSGCELAVKRFQEKNSLKVDGKVGPNTFEKLFS